jgi:pSer/pThr/pTyr-binding forkhead associated (FHA) protein
MSDPRLDSCHLDLPRRQDYRDARQGVLEGRGWLTLAGECARDLAGEPGDWPSLFSLRPDQLVPGARFLLIDDTGDCTYPLKTGLNTLGRLSNNDIVVGDPYISRRHCVLIVHALGGCDVHDTASRNGTYVNGRRLRDPVRLSSGDRIAVCRRELLFVDARDCRIAPGHEDSSSDTAWA